MAKHQFTYKEIDGQSIDADVYYDGEGTSASRPVALYFHGGNFVSGSKELLGKLHIQKLLEFGFVVVSANYRLCPTISLAEGPVSDALDAYQWVRERLPTVLKEQTGVSLDVKKIVVFGHSCGATLALLTAGQSEPPLAILDIFGMKYLQDPAFHTASENRGPPIDDAFVNQIFQQVPAPSTAAPPMAATGPDLKNPRIAWMFSAVKKGALIESIVADGNYETVDPAFLFSKGKFPPTYFIHGTADTLVPHKLSQKAHDELVAAGHESHLVLVEGAPHGLDARMQEGDDTYRTIVKGLEFLKAHI
ncbi:alpha/beta-hydrolase [Cadophora sp. DSE1049]|nr:alpha/beta-hydrolase [Cadophora sp. DSE1049]